MNYVILGLLLSGPLTLYDVRKRFSSGISLFYSASSGGIERALRRLLDDGHATIDDAADSGRGRRLYSATPAGRAAWKDWMTAPIPSGADAETMILAKVFLVGRLDDARARKATLEAARARAAADLESLRQLDASVRSAATNVPTDALRVFDYQYATLTHGLRAHAATVDWIDSLLEEGP